MYNLEDIKIKFNKVVKYSQKLEGEVNSDTLFADWEINKKDFINAWDGNLIKELGEFSFHLNIGQRLKAISNMLDQFDYIIRESGIKYPDIKADALYQFIIENEENFFDNITIKDYNMIDGTKIPKGMKILRAFKFFCADKELLNNLQSAASMIIQNDKITGILCMSVHPLDYLSVSETTYNWRSCHALDGEYRAGNLNYMADSTTVVCYLKSTHKEILPRFPEDIKWNSKKWRMLLFFDEERDFMMAGRQYPFSEDSILLEIKREVEKMFNYKFSGWFDKYITNINFESFIEEPDNSNQYEFYFPKKYLPVGDRILSLRKLVQDADGTLQFNDLLQSSVYEYPYYSFKLWNSWLGNYLNKPNLLSSSKLPKIKVGKKCTCLECNKEDITMSEAFLCIHCMVKEGQTDDTDIFETCSICGRRYIVEEGSAAYDEFGNSCYVCRDCANSECRYCRCCGELYFEDALNEEDLCSDCRENQRVEDNYELF